jgi:hypothetical protein
MGRREGGREGWLLDMLLGSVRAVALADDKPSDDEYLRERIYKIVYCQQAMPPAVYMCVVWQR